MSNIDEIMREMLKEEMEFEITFKNGLKLLVTVKEINEVVAEDKIRAFYGDAVEKVEYI